MSISERKKCPPFIWDKSAIHDLLAEVNFSQKKLLNEMKSLGFQLKEEIILKVLTENVLKTSEIAGETLDAEKVRCLIAKKFGLDVSKGMKIDRNVQGVVAMIMDACENFDKALTQTRLLKWHAALFPARDKAIGGEEMPKEMTRFLKWYNAPPDMDLILKAAIAHLWLMTIHPFTDGNGRISRAIADRLLAKSEGNPQRFYSMSAQIEKEKHQYYAILENSKKGSLDVTEWLMWFLHCLKSAVLSSMK